MWSAISLVLLIGGTTHVEGFGQDYDNDYDSSETWLRKHIIDPVCPTEGLFYVSTIAQCEYENVSISCKDPLYARTVAHISCRYGYRKRNDIITCQSDGTWDHEPWLQCEQICGVIDRNSSEAPWHAAIYDGNNKECGGSIVSAKLVLTTNSCFRIGKSISNYRIGIGMKRTYSLYFPTLTFQMLNISKLIGPWEGHPLIGIVVKDSIVFRPQVMPICIDIELYGRLLTESDVVTLNAKIAGYHYPRNKNELSVARSITDYRLWCYNQTCDKNLNIFQRDVMCASDYGSGVAIKSNDETEAYFLFAIVVRDQILMTDTCKRELKLISFKNREIQDLVTAGRNHRSYYTPDQEIPTPSSEYCSTFESRNMKLRNCNYNGFERPCIDPIIPNTRAYFSCKDGYQMEGDASTSIVCKENGEWSNTLNPCVSSCTLPQLTPHVIAYYDGERMQIGNGERVKEFASIKYVCDDGYVINGIKETFCDRGKWQGRVPNCLKRPVIDMGETFCVLPELSPNLKAYNKANQEIQGRDKAVNEVIYKCEDGYELRGSRINLCTFGAWVEVAPTCVQKLPATTPIPIDVICTLPELPPNLEAYDITRFSGLVSVNYKCKSNYKLEGAKGNTCHQGKWLSPTPTCKPDKLYCIMPVLPPNVKAYYNKNQQ